MKLYYLYHMKFKIQFSNVSRVGKKKEISVFVCNQTTYGFLVRVKTLERIK